MLEQRVQETPIATKLLLEAARKIDESPIRSVYLVFCPTTGFKGTGFLLGGNRIVTCRHVIKGENVAKIVLQSATSQIHRITRKIEDAGRDLAILASAEHLGPGLDIAESDMSRVGERLWTWGYPLGYNGPPPLAFRRLPIGLFLSIGSARLSTNDETLRCKWGV